MCSIHNIWWGATIFGGRRRGERKKVKGKNRKQKLEVGSKRMCSSALMI
jgi:hypothetical protein